MIKMTEHDLRFERRKKLIETMEPLCRHCQKSILVPEEFVIVVGATYEIFFHEACVDSALDLKMKLIR
jgi:hypothetical protein